MPDIVITPNRGTSNNPKIDFTGTSAGTIKLEVLADGSIAWNGANGSLFSIADSLSGSLMSVNDISGLPAFEVFSDNRVIVGQFGAKLGIGITNPSYKLDVSGTARISGATIISGATTFNGGNGSQVNGNGSTLSLTVNGNWNSGVGSLIQLTTSDLNFWSNGGIYYFKSSAGGNVATINSTNGNIETTGGVAINKDGDYSNLANGISLWGTSNSTTSLSLFKSWNSIFSRTNTLMTNGYATYHIMDTAGRGWIWRYATGGSAGTNVASLRNDTGQMSLGTAWDWSGGYHAQLNIAAGQGSATTYRDIDLHGSWSAGEGHAITATYSTGANNIVGQIVFQYDSPNARIRFGKLHYNGDTSSYPLELIATSATAANLILNNGNVGIGTTSPSTPLHIYKTGLADNSTNPLLTIDGKFVSASIDTNDIVGIAFRVENSTGGSQTTTSIGSSYQPTYNGLLLQPTGGNVGIGTTSPSYKLHVEGDSYSSTGFYVRNSAATFIGSVNNMSGMSVNGTSYDTLIYSGGNQAITVKSGGNVGIGTSSPAYKLEVIGDAKFGSGACNLYMVGDQTWRWIAGTSGYGVGSGFGLYHDTGGAYRLAIDTNGNVGIGTTTPSSLLHLHGNTNSWSTSPTIVMSSSSANANVRNWRIGPADTVHGNFHIGVSDTLGGLVDTDAEANAFTISYDKKVGIGNTSPSYKLHVSGDIYANGGWFRVGGNLGYYFDTHGGGWYMTDSTWLRAYNDKAIVTNNEVRATIFRDANDTNYYVDPASTSDSALRIRGGTLYGPNTTWGAYLMVGGDGRQNYIDNTSTASVTTTNGNLHLDAASGSNSYINWYDGNDLLVGTGDSGTLRLRVYGPSNYTEVTGSMRAPIFYDTDDTNYYVDGNAGTALKYLRVNGDWGGSPFGSSHETFTITGTYASMCQRQTNGNLGYWLHHIDSGGTYHLYGGRGNTNGSGWNWAYRAYTNTDGNHVEFRTSARAPIFYDSDNTGYYCDPASVSNLYSIQSVYLNGNYTNTSAYNSSNGLLSTPTGIRSQASFITFTDGNAIAPYALYRTSGDWPAPYGIGWGTGGESSGIFQRYASNGFSFGDMIFYVNNDGSGAFRWVTGTWEGTAYNGAGSNHYGNTAMSLDWSGNLQANGSVRGPIFYDSNDTNYYLDPASTSRVNTISFVSGATFGPYFQYSNQSNLRLQAGAQSAAVGMVGFDYNGNWRFQLYGDTNGYGFLYGDWAGWDIKKIATGNLYLNGETTYYIGTNEIYYNRVYGIADIRSPIFYDNNNTGYYIDGNSTSYLNSLYLYGGLTTTGNTRLGQSSGTTTRIDDILQVGASDSGDSHLYFGEDTSNWYGAHWYWDSGYTHYWYSRNGGTDSTLMQYATNDTTKITFGRNIEFNNYGKGIIGTYASTRYQGVFAMGESYKLPDDGNGVGTLYGIAWSHPNAGGAAGNLASHGMLILENGTFKGAWGGGRLVTTSDIRGTVFYDYDNTGYYVDPTGNANIANSVYVGGWFRNYGNQGLYNETHGNHWYATGNDFWNLAGNNASNIGIILRSGGHQGTIRGYVYADSNNHIGFLNDGGAWRLRVVSGDYTLADGSSIRGQLFYDSNDTNYYIDPASTGTSANFAGNIIVANGRTDAYIYMGDTDEGQRVIHNNSNRIGFLNQSSGWGAWCDDSGYWQSDTSIRGPLFYDSNDTNYYVDPASTSNLNRLLIQPRNDNYYVGTVSYVNSVSDWQSLTNTTGQFTVTQMNNFAAGGFSNYPSSVYTYGSVLSWRTEYHSFQLYAAHTGDITYKTQWANDNYSGWLYPMVYGRVNGGGGSIYGTIFYDQNDSGYYVDPNSTSKLNNLQVAGGISDPSTNGRIYLYGNLHIDAFNGYDIYANYYSGRRFRTFYGAQNESFRCDTDGIVYAYNHIRTPYIYDYNNTAYYFDGNNTSVMNLVTVNSLGVGTSVSGTTGEIRATNNITAYYSDERLKTRLGKIEDPIAKVKSLSGFYFEANETAVALGYDKKREVGVSAQEVQAVLPEIIAPAPISDKYMTVRYEKLIPLLIEAIKEQQTQIEQLSNELKSLKNKL